MGRQALLGLTLLVSVFGGAGCDKETVVAPSLVVSCAATPATGPAPLAVTFALNVGGAQGAFTVAIDYGDGAQGSDPGRSHSYLNAGSYNAAFTVTTPSQSARCSAAVTVGPGSGLGPSPTPSPSPTENGPPEPTFRTEPEAVGGVLVSGQAPLTVHFDMCRTADPDGDRLYFEMDLDGNGSFEFRGATGVDCRHERVYVAGTHAPRVCVSDIECPWWPSCEGVGRLHSPRCRTYSVVATP